MAEKTGFTNSSYFYRMFKKFNGVTPNDYRRKELHSEQL
ncbi:helix-turn-helix domain-containing protein [Paenibacillus xylanilyticus]